MKFSIHLAVFKYRIYFYIGEDTKKDFLKDISKTKLDNDVLGYCTSNFIWVKDIDDVSVLVHEIHHAKYNLVERDGIDDEETEAYIVEYLVKHALIKIKGAK